MTSTRRTARSEDLIVEAMDDESIVYDRRSDSVHHLNATTSAIWRLCDGQTDLAAMQVAASRVVGAQIPAEAVAEAIRLLDEASLLLPSSDAPSAGLSRRKLLIGLGVGAVAIPVLTTIVAPTPAAASSCGGQTSCQLGSSTPTPCPGETTIGSGCRCGKPSAPSQCGPCVAQNGTAGEARLCCTPAGWNSGTGVCTL